MMTARRDEAEQVRGGDPGRRAVDQRVAIDLGEARKRRIHHDRDLRRRPVQQGERRHRARRHAEHGFEQRRFAEAEAAKPEADGERLQIDRAVLLGDDQHHVAILVDEEQILGMRARQAAARNPATARP